MKKAFYFTWVALLSLSGGGLLHAQANSVELKDGGGTLISSHSSVADAYAAIPATLSQAYVIELQSSYSGSNESYPIVFVAKSGASAANTITLRPAAGVASVNMQANVASNPVLQLNDADYVHIDGRAGGTGTARNLSISNLGTGSSANTVALINGACFNRISYCNILNATTGSAGRGLFLGTSPSNASGNSDNRIEYCYFPSGRYQLNSNGTSATPNTRNTIFGCIFENIKFVGIWSQAGNAKMLIDSCSFFCTTNSGDGAYGILFDTQTDSVIIRNNRIYDLQNGTGASIRGIHVRSVAGSGNNFTDIYNNFIALGNNTSTQTSVVGIEYSGTNLINARVRYNTIRITGTLTSSGTSGNVGSTPFLKAASTSTSQFDIRNNIFVNERSGGNAGLQHLAMAITSNNDPLNIDFNTYNSTWPSLIRLGSTLYNTFASYQAAAAPGTETSSNDYAVQLVSATDLHLSGTSIGNGNLAGTVIAGISTDIDGDTRGSIPYRGADEALTPLAPGCSGVPAPGTTTAATVNICSGQSAALSLSGLDPLAIPVLSFQWQSSTNGTSFSNIGGANAQSYNSSNLSQDTWFRCIVTCSTSGLSDTSAALQISILQPPAISSISETHIVGQYTFTANGVSGATSYLWSFGNGNTSTAVSPTHTYASSGSYTVSLVVANACGSDTATLAINVGCEGIPDGGTASSSSNSVCAGQSITLSLLGINNLLVPTLSFQWQSSPDGISYSNISGATSLTHTTTPSALTHYRCVVTCNASGQSNNSSAVTIAYSTTPVISSISETHSGGTYTFTPVGLTNANSVSWTFGNGATSNVTSPTYTYPIGGTYTVTVTAVNACGTTSQTLTITGGCTGAPAQAGVQASATNVCSGDALQLQLSGLDTADASFYTYQWQGSSDGVNFSNVPAGTSAILNTTVGTLTHFRCIVTCTGSGQSTTSQTLTITIGAAPSGGSISASNNDLVYTFSINGLSGTYTYAWDFGDGSTGTGSNPQHTYAANGVYNVSVVVSSNCGSATFTYTVTANVGLDNAAESMGLHLYPNPASDLVQIISDKLTQADHIRISDMSGKTCWIKSGTVSFPVQLSIRDMGLQNGLYLIEIHSGSQKTILKLIVK